MKKRIFSTTLLWTLLAIFPLLAQSSLHKVKTASSQVLTTRTTETITLTQCAAAIYDVGEDGLGDYYLIFSEKGNAVVDLNEGTITTSDDHLLTLDLYAGPTSPIELPTGVYSSGESGTMTYYPDYSYSAYYNSNGVEESSSLLSGGVEVEKNSDETYTITVTDASGVTYTYTGSIKFTDPSASTYVYPQIAENIEATFTGGMAFYNGNLYESKTGNMYINLFDCDFDSETGQMYEDGYDLAICAFSKLFNNSANAKIMPGTYTVAQNFKANTYYPGMEIDYLGTTIAFGSYVKRRTTPANGGEADYAVTYIVDGTITITEGSTDGTYCFAIDCVTDDGYTVKGTATDISITIIDQSDDESSAVVSNLDRDVVLNLDYIKTARVYYTGLQNGVNVFVVDIGSPSGKDGTEGDLMRMEFQADHSTSELPMGTYELMEENHLWTNMYAPYKLTQGYFTDQGELIGTRYWHFAKDRYEVVDTFASVIAGRISVEKVENTDNYHFTIDVEDGNAFTITGEWTGPMEICYDIEGIQNAYTETGSLSIEKYNGSNLVLRGVTNNEVVNIFSADGRLALRTSGTNIDVGNLPQGIYIIKVNNKQPLKYIKQ